ncbi:D-glycero-beta-D-manno-heptose-7-phosphate kinase [Pelagibius sp. Alg239-R121]|uniref:D-glycero-beta-D-manno-heptose-7-phosphate kinase n=1 Tax=Pelagibius sp. Alg239-R121 TaxID=2993448 RepID=UPI0024A7350F|nr:D-glycero-beta-D-manno-heptose-7-phosphate kinase [Pelagibius sp. Alg239-R121]
MTEPTDLLELVDRLDGARVMVVGDVMLDRFLYGAVDRVSPEAPIPVLRLEREVTMLGGAGNVLRNLTAIGAKTTFISVVGDDPAGREIRQLVERESHEPGSISLMIDGERASTIKERYIATGQQLLRADRETPFAMSASTRDGLLAAAEQALEQAGALILSDYGKGVLPGDVVSHLIARAKDLGCPVVVDPKAVDYSYYRGAALVTPNKRELAQASGQPVQGDDAIVEACRAVIESAELGGVLATRSEEGMSLVIQGREACHLPARAREVYDVSGAGDTVVAVLGAALAAGIKVEAAAGLANVAAGIVVGKTGTAVAEAMEIRQAIYASRLSQAEAKFVDQELLLDQIVRWRQAGFKVGFTNGCFDLLHPGHISLLRQARAACDRLVVGLNSDASVARLKGPARPVQVETARAVVLASLEDVDRVVVFGEDTPLALIEALRPDVLVKGADYTVEEVVGAKEVQSYGGTVVLAELQPGHSTTATITRLAESN